MNPINKYFSIAVVSATTLISAPAYAFSVGGTPVYSFNGLPTELSVIGEFASEDAQFTVSNPSTLDVGVLSLNGSLGVFGITDSATYAAVPSYISGFQFLGQNAVFSINAGEGVISGFANNTNFTIDASISGSIEDLSGNLLGTAIGSFSAVRTANQVGDFSLNLEGTAIPTPALLPGLLGMAVGVLRKRNQEVGQEAVENKLSEA